MTAGRANAPPIAAVALAVVGLTVGLAIFGLGCINVRAILEPPPPISDTNCPGCALLSVPLTTANTATTFAINLSGSDLSGATITYRLCVLSGTPQTILQPFVKNGGPGYAEVTTAFPFASLSPCSRGFQDVDLAVTTDGGLDPTAIVQIGLQIASGDPGPWSNPTMVLVDSIQVSGDVVGPWTFDTAVDPLTIDGYMPIDGSTLTWVGPAGDGGAPSDGASDQSTLGPAVSETSCPGCAILSVPLAAANTGTLFDIPLPLTDLTGATVTFRLCVVSGTESTFLQPFVQDGAPNYGGQFDVHALNTISSCSSGLQDLVLNVTPMSGFDPTAVASIGLEIAAQGAGPWTDPTVVLVDSVTVSPTSIGPWTFDTAASPLQVNPYQPVIGSAVSWVGGASGDAGADGVAPTGCAVCPAQDPPCIPAPTTSSNLLAGFESGCPGVEPAHGSGGYWYTIDNPDGTVIDQTPMVACGGAQLSCYSLCVRGTLNGTNYPYAMLVMRFNAAAAPIDLSAYSGISFYASGTINAGAIMQLNMPTSADTPIASGGTCDSSMSLCNDPYSAGIWMTPGSFPWVRYSLPFTTLHQQGFGTSEVLDLTTVISLNWAVLAAPGMATVTGSDFTLCVDDIELVP